VDWEKENVKGERKEKEKREIGGIEIASSPIG